MRKLLQINECLNLSTGKITQQIGELAIAKGWESWIAYSGREKELPSKSHLIRVGNFMDSCIHYAEDRFLDNEGLSSRRETKKLIKKINEIKPDVIHLHNIHDHWLNYKLLFTYLAKSNIPVVWTQHDQWATTGHCYYNLVGCERWKEGCHSCPLSKWYCVDQSQRNYKLKKQLLANIPSLTIVAVSDWLGNNIRLSHLNNRPIQIIHNGIDLNIFSPHPVNAHERYGIDKHKKIILGVAAIWDARKGLNDFYELAKGLPADKYAFVIVGSRIDKVKPVDEGCQMVFLDRTQNALELAQLYSSAAVFVNPTYQDNYPTTNLEAIACGTPVITYNTGGSPESVDEKTGTVVEQGDIEGIISAIERLAYGDYRDNCRKKAEAEFDKLKCFNSYILLYNKLLSGGGYVILGVSNIWSDDKGLTDLITLSKNPNNVVVLVGMSQEQVKKYSSEAYRDYNLIPIQRTHNQCELAMLYSLADVYVNPTYADMFPTVNLEALACGTPVITYRTGGSPEAIDDKTGAVIEQGDLSELCEKINEFKLINFKKMHTADCRRRALEKFDKNKCFEEYVDLYQKILSENANNSCERN